MRPITAFILIIMISTPQQKAWADEAQSLSPWSIHGQSTGVSQAHPGFPALYSGVNSLSSGGEWDTSFTATLFVGRTLWKGAEIFVNPEVSGGSGFSGTHGVAGFPNGEIYRVDTPTPKPNLSRLYIRQFFNLGDATELLENDVNAIAREVSIQRLSVTFGKFSLNDFFDNNAYAHDPRTQFLNWGFMDNLAWDYAADTRGYTWALMVEYNQTQFAVRIVSAMEPKEANQLELDTNLAQAHGNNAELEYRYRLSGHEGRSRFLVYDNHARMGIYEGTDITQTRAYRSKYGLGLNLEQALSPALGAFSRLGWNNGKTESWAFTEADRTVSLGVNLKGDSWSRPDDHLGFALLMNWISPEHAHYLAAGGSGFLLGDGGLSFASEQILEAIYIWTPIRVLSGAVDFQFINHPGYNSDRGPAEVFSLRLHYQI